MLTMERKYNLFPYTTLFRSNVHLTLSSTINITIHELLFVHDIVIYHTIITINYIAHSVRLYLVTSTSLALFNTNAIAVASSSSASRSTTVDNSVHCNISRA